MNPEEVQQKIQVYENFIETKLKSDMKCIEERLKEASTKYTSWEEVKNVAKHWKSIAEADRDTEVMFPIGGGVCAFGEVTEYGNILVDIGAGVLLEMEFDEAMKYAEIRLNVVRKEINHLRKLAVNVKVHLKMVLLAISQLQESVVGLNKR